MNLEKVHELNELSSDAEHNMPEMMQLAHELVEDMMPSKDRISEICKWTLQNENCKSCLFDILCNSNNKNGMSI